MKTLRISIVALAAFALFLTASCEKIDITVEDLDNVPGDSIYMTPNDDTSNDLDLVEESNYREEEKLPEV